MTLVPPFMSLLRIDDRRNSDISSCSSNILCFLPIRAEEISGEPPRLLMVEGKRTPGRTRPGYQMAASTNDLSISELSLSLKPFSLLATPIDQEESAVQQPQRNPDKAREEKLQSDIFILKKLNASFELFNEALHDTGSANKVLLHFTHSLHPSYHSFF